MWNFAPEPPDGGMMRPSHMKPSAKENRRGLRNTVSQVGATLPDANSSRDFGQ
jgi:hypothetical protein